jgi:hypothetical protein
MRSTSPKKAHDEMVIPEGRFKEAYTPVANRKILSPALNKYLKYAKFQLSADATVTYRTLGGALVTAEALTAASGTQPYLVSEIHSVSAGTCYIVHDGIIETGVDQP